MNIEQAKVYKERALKIKVLLDEFFVDMQGNECFEVSTPVGNMARQNRKLILNLDNLLSRWNPENLPLEELHLRMVISEACGAHLACSIISSDFKKYNIPVSQKMQKLLEKTTDSLKEIEDYFEAKNER